MAKAKYNSVQKAVMNNRARLILGEQQLDAQVAAEFSKLLPQWENEVRQLLTATKKNPSNTRSAVAMSSLLKGIGVVSNQFVQAVEKLVNQKVDEVYRREVFKIKHALADGTKEVGQANVGIAFGGVSKAKLLASTRTMIPKGILGKKITPALTKRIRKDLVEATIKGKGIDWLEKKWTPPAGTQQVIASAKVLARTAVLATSNAAALATYKAEGIYKQVQWEASFDVRTCPYCASMHGRIFDINKAPPIPAHPNCVLPDTRVSTGAVIAATRAVYDGYVVTIRTALGRELTVTENHPVLTTRGFVAAHRLQVGDHVLCRSGQIGSSIINPHGDDRPTLAENIFASMLVTRGFLRRGMPSAPVQFHGDGIFLKGQVDVVSAERHLDGCPLASLDQQIIHAYRVAADEGWVPGSPAGDLDAVLLALRFAAYGRVRRFNQLHPFLGCGVRHPQVHRLAAVALRDPAMSQPPNNQSSGNAKAFGQCLDRLPELVQSDQIIVCHRKHYAGFVHDFSTVSGAYTANTVIVHNCRCVLLPVLPDAKLEQSIGQPGKYPSPSPAAALAQDRKFETWLQTQSRQDQREFFGSKLKMKAWEDQKVFLPDMVRMDGSMLSDAELVKKIKDKKWVKEALLKSVAPKPVKVPPLVSIKPAAKPKPAPVSAPKPAPVPVAKPSKPSFNAMLKNMTFGDSAKKIVEQYEAAGGGKVTKQQAMKLVEKQIKLDAKMEANAIKTEIAEEKAAKQAALLAKTPAAALPVASVIEPGKAFPYKTADGSPLPPDLVAKIELGSPAMAQRYAASDNAAYRAHHRKFVRDIVANTEDHEVVDNWKDGWYTQIRRRLTGQTTSMDPATLDKQVDKMNDLFTGAPAIERTVYRGMSFASEQQIIDHIKPGKVVYNSYASASQSRKVIHTFSGGPDEISAHFTIRSKSGIDIGKIGRLKNEKEVLIRPGTQFKVLKHKRRAIKRYDTARDRYIDVVQYDIELEEIT